MHIQNLTPTGTPETGSPPADRLISGNPVFTTWNFEDDKGLFCGIWEATPGKWSAFYDEWEYCRILSGVLIITEDGREPVTYRAGDSFIIRPGFRGTWHVIETVRKDYVIRL